MHPGPPTDHAAPRSLRVLQMCAVDFTVRQFLLPLARGLQAHGHRVSIACTRGPYFDELRAMGFDMRENPVSRSMNAFSHAVAIYRTWRLLRSDRFDVLHVHTPIAALVGRIAARLAGVPVRLYTAHGFYFHDEMPPAKRRFHIALEKLGARCGTHILTVSDEDRRTAIELGIARPGAIETIFNGVDTGHFDPARFDDARRRAIREQHGMPAGSPVVGLVGRLVREKGFFEFVRAAKIVLATHPEARFLVVGDVLPSDHDGSRDELNEEIQKLGIAERVVFAGMVKDTAPCLAAMDIFCLPSYREGMPISLLEAMAMELPAVATDIRGCREEVADGQTGWLVPTRDETALADRLLRLLANPAEARAFGKAARERVLTNFNIATVIENQVRIYDRLTAGLAT
jgi:glycosyltransferase involved in cell wall biosynthesis